MNIITAPSVYLVGKQIVDQSEMMRFLDDHNISKWSTDAPSYAEELVETAGRLCYMSFAKPRPGGNKAYIGHILEVGHGSVLEHAVYSLIITGVSRSLTHELIRHRVGISPSQLSQRFVDESDCSFVLPPLIKQDSPQAATWASCVGRTLGTYQSLAESLYAGLEHIEDKTRRRKMAREAARSVLPNCTETKICLTGNARAWRHFIEMRGTIDADGEIQRLALVVQKVLQAESPNLFGDYTVTDQGIETPWRKV